MSDVTHSKFYFYPGSNNTIYTLVDNYIKQYKSKYELCIDTEVLAPSKKLIAVQEHFNSPTFFGAIVDTDFAEEFKNEKALKTGLEQHSIYVYESEEGCKQFLHELFAIDLEAELANMNDTMDTDLAIDRIINSVNTNYVYNSTTTQQRSYTVMPTEPIESVANPTVTKAEVIENVISAPIEEVDLQNKDTETIKDTFASKTSVRLQKKPVISSPVSSSINTIMTTPKPVKSVRVNNSAMSAKQIAATSVYAGTSAVVEENADTVSSAIVLDSVEPITLSDLTHVVDEPVLTAEATAYSVKKETTEDSNNLLINYNKLLADTQKLQVQNTTLAAAIDSLKAERDGYEELASEAIDVKAQLENSIKTLNNNIATLNTDKRALQKSLKTKGIELSTLTQNLDAANEILEETRKAKAALEVQVTKLKVALDSAVSAQEITEVKYTNTQQTLNSANAEIETLQQHLDVLELQLNEKANKITRLESQIENLTIKHNAELDNLKSLHTEDLQDLKVKHEKNLEEAIETACKSLNATIESLKIQMQEQSQEALNLLENTKSSYEQELQKQQEILEDQKSNSVGIEEYNRAAAELKDKDERYKQVNARLGKYKQMETLFKQSLVGQIAQNLKAPYNVNNVTIDAVGKFMGITCMSVGSCYGCEDFYLALTLSCQRISQLKRKVMILDLAPNSIIDGTLCQNATYDTKQVNDLLNWLDNPTANLTRLSRPSKYPNIHVLSIATSYVNPKVYLNFDWAKILNALSLISQRENVTFVITVGCLEDLVSSTIFSVLAQHVYGLVYTSAKQYALRNSMLSLASLPASVRDSLELVIDTTSAPLDHQKLFEFLNKSYTTILLDKSNDVAMPLSRSMM